SHRFNLIGLEAQFARDLLLAPRHARVHITGKLAPSDAQGRSLIRQTGNTETIREPACSDRTPDSGGHAGDKPGRPHGRSPIVMAVVMAVVVAVIIAVVIAGIIVPPVASRSTSRRHRSPADAAMRAWHGAPRVVAHAEIGRAHV